LSRIEHRSPCAACMWIEQIEHKTHCAAWAYSEQVSRIEQVGRIEMRQKRAGSPCAAWACTARRAEQ
jgi:hypothetical protein